MRYEGKGGMSGKKIRQVDTQIPDQPDRDESRNAVKKRDQKLVEKVAVEDRHGSHRQKPVAGGRKEHDSESLASDSAIVNTLPSRPTP